MVNVIKLVDGPKHVPYILEAGVNALLQLGAIELQQMTKEQYMENTEEEKKAEEAEVWNEFLQNAPVKDLPQA
jgi:single-stranded DNA-specific DHH superfamily exonuclease